MPVEEALQRAVAEDKALLTQEEPDLLDRAIRLRPQRRKDGILACLDSPRLAVPAESLRPGIALCPLQRPPAAHARRTSPRTAPPRPGASRRPRPPPEPEHEDQPTRLSTCPPASIPADSLNHLSPDLGIPIQSDRLMRQTSIPAESVSVRSHPCASGLRFERPWRLFGFYGTAERDPGSPTGLEAKGVCGLPSATAATPISDDRKTNLQGSQIFQWPE